MVLFKCVKEELQKKSFNTHNSTIFYYLLPKDHNSKLVGPIIIKAKYMHVLYARKP
jgi:hypothetical protein